MTANLTDEQLERLWDYAWKYFSMHAEQRLKTFHFYLIICAAMIAGAATVYRGQQLMTLAGIPFLSLPLLSLIFWRLDVRNGQLVRHGEDAIKFLEELMTEPSHDEKPHVLKIMSREDAVTKEDLPLRYSHCLNSVFLVIGIGGALFGILLTIASWKTV